MIWSYAVLELQKAGYHPPYDATVAIIQRMARLLLNIRNVPDDEADDVRAT